MLAAMFPTVFAAEETVDSAYYGIADGMIGQIQPGTDEGTLLSRLLYRGQATVDGGVKTGSALNLENGDSLTLVVQGDCNEDGNFTLSDFLKVKSLLLSLEEFSPAQTQAGDLSGDGRLTLTDTASNQVIATRLFGNDGVYTLSDLAAGSYEVTFEGYGYVNDEAEFNAKFEIVASNKELLDDDRAYAKTINFASQQTIDNGAIGKETAGADVVDWFVGTGLAPAADGTVSMDFGVEGDQILVNVYKLGKDGVTLETLGGFVVNDTLNTEGVTEYDLTKTFYGVSATDTIYLQVFGFGQSNYNVNLASTGSLI
jgi:hypothetical protein